MQHGANEKTVVMISPAALTAGGKTSGLCDTLGFDYATIEFTIGTTGTSATDNPSVLTLGEDDTQSTTSTVVTNFTAISTGDTDFTIPTGVTSGSQTIRWEVPLQTRKRYLNLNVTAGAATGGATCIAKLGRAEQCPTTASAKGVTTLVRV